MAVSRGANTGFIAYLTENADAIAAAGRAERGAPNWPVIVGVWTVVFGPPTIGMLSDGFVLLGAPLGLLAVAFGVRGWLSVSRGDQWRFPAAVAVLGGLYMIGLAIEHWVS